MIKLKDLLNERSDLYYASKPPQHLFPKGSGESPMFGIVISHKDGITPAEAEDIIKIFKKSDSASDLKYYPATQKVIGKVVIFKFFDNKWQYRTNHTSLPDINKSKNKYELDKVKKGMVITKKKIYK